MFIVTIDVTGLGDKKEAATLKSMDHHHLSAIGWNVPESGNHRCRRCRRTRSRLSTESMRPKKFAKNDKKEILEGNWG